MKIIDAHIHFKSSPGFDRLAIESGHVNSAPHLESVFGQMNIAHAVVMGNEAAGNPPKLPSFLSYCIGLDSESMESQSITGAIDDIEANISRQGCVGIKLYPGYNRRFITDPVFSPIYELAGYYGKPVAVHTGATANAGSHLKYCHPLIIDEIAADFPKTTFVICHFGNPWVLDAAAVIDKNPNVCADLSGILDGGRHNVEAYCRENSGYMEYLKLWIKYPCAFDRFMYGTDWPLVNMAEYADFVSRLIPERHWDDVFFNNANKIYSLGL